MWVCDTSNLFVLETLTSNFAFVLQLAFKLEILFGEVFLKCYNICIFTSIYVLKDAKSKYRIRFKFTFKFKNFILIK